MRVEDLAAQLEIRQLGQRYADAIDTMRFERLDEVFEPGARLRYELDGNSFDVKFPEAVAAAIRPALERCAWTCHLIGEPLIEQRGDLASSVMRVIATHIQQRNDGSQNNFVVTGMYYDELARTAHGWRIRDRYAKFPCVQGTFLADGVALHTSASRSGAA